MTANVKKLKEDLLVQIDRSEADGTYSDEVFEQIHESIKKLLPLTPIPRPIDEEDKLTSTWGTLYAQFGPRHTAGKPLEHENLFHFISFGVFPKSPFLMKDISQEIHHETKDYNNVHAIRPVGGNLDALLTVYGRYRLEEDNPQRYIVDFYEAEISGANGESDEVLREAFGFDADQALKLPVKAPKLHSDVVYCDDEMRINFGSQGGVYVLKKLDRPSISVHRH